MRKSLIVLLLLLILTLSAVDMPDFKYIVNKQHEAARMKAESYSRWMDNISENMRNMDCYDVHYYSIDIEIDFELHYVEGIVLSHLEILEDNISLISFNFTTDLDVDEILMNSSSLVFTHADDIIEIELGTSFNTGDIIELEVHYSGYPQNRLNDGMKFQEHAGVPIVFTMVSPKGARKWWPCKDTPADKPDSLDISITYPSQYISTSNGTLTEVINNGNGTNTAIWHELYPICTYLTSFAVTNYQTYSFNWEYNGTNMMVDNFIYPEQYDISIELYSLCGDMLTFYSDTYGEYPFITEKYGHATCTNLGALAMEHQTVTSFDSGYISDPAAEYTVAHELSHHWAGDALSIGGWDHVWLKEGFASYSEALWAEHLFGLEGLHAYMEAEDTGSQLDECLYRDPEGSGNHIFNIVIYNKGSWVIHMLRGLLGDDYFFLMLQNFFQDPDLIYGNIITQDLENAAEYFSNGLDWFFDQWYYNYGRPQYKYVVYTSEVEDSIRVTLHSEGSAGDPFSMYVPYKINDNYSGRYWAEDGFNYYVDMPFEDLDSFVFDPDNWVLDYGYLEQTPVLEEIELQRNGAVVLVWNEFFDPAIEGMNVYRKQAGEDYIILNSEPVCGTAYYDDDVILEEEYYYRIAAVFQAEGNYISSFSNEISTIPVNFALNEGILVVDGTLDGLSASPFPTDEEVDEYYANLLSGYPYTNWDIVEQGLPPLTEIAKYSSVIWHTDDISNYPFVNSVYNMKCYLLAGGNLFASCWKQLCMVSENFQNYFLYLDESVTHNQADFAGAFGINGFTDIAVDIDKIPLSNWGGNLQYVNKFLPIEDAEAIFVYDSFSNDPTWENAVCGQRFSGDYKTYILGFPLYFMIQEQAENIVQSILEDFGEESSIGNYELEVINCKLTNYPNPFNPITTISFDLTTEFTESTELIIYNLKGQKVRNIPVILSDAQHCIEGLGETKYSVTWNGTNDNNHPVSSGIYFYKLKSGDIEISKKMLLLK
ncbi:MAG: M1 family aminopeptidase [Candidatus Cloacimonadota bacterium]|nr:M1 family aminopeptidase [Candidatus Cloacimonadota bacterium]